MHQRHIKRKLITFKDQRDLRIYYKQLPQKVKQRCKVFPYCRSLSLFEEDYSAHFVSLSKQMIKKDAGENFYVEDNIILQLHQVTKEIPWGVSFVQAHQAWRKTEGAGVKVGVIDTGIDGKHPDLKGLIAGGINTVDRSSPYTDSNGHGTHVAGTIAAARNGLGVVGVAPRTSLYAIKAFQADGTATVQDLLEGLEWAIRQKLDILNLSFGTDTPSIAMEQAIRTALQSGLLIVASAGNSGGAVSYPAKYSGVIAVGALDRQGRVASFSSRGKGLDYVEPGVDIHSTWPGGQTEVLSGTSMAAPHLVGILALLKGYYSKLTPSIAKSVIAKSAIRLPNVSERDQGKGTVRFGRIITVARKYGSLLRKYR